MLDNSKVIRNKEIIILEKKREETNTQEKEINLSSTTLDTLFDDIFKYTFASFECQVIRNKLEIIILEKRNDSQEKEIFHSIDTKRRFTNIYHNEKKEEEKKGTNTQEKEIFHRYNCRFIYHNDCETTYSFSIELLLNTLKSVIIPRIKTFLLLNLKISIKKNLPTLTIICLT